MDLERMAGAARDGDQDAYRALVEPHMAGAYRVALLIMLDRDLAHDAVQEALVRAYRSLRAFDPGRPFGPWLQRIVVNEARRLLRRQGRQPALLAELPELPAPTGDRPEEAFLAQEERERLWQGLAGLDELHRTVLVLRYYQGLSEAEMASVLGVKAGTVKSRLHGARRLLQEHLGGEPSASRRMEPWHRRILHAIQRGISHV